ncbi:MAG: hypothetical protein IKI03_07415 [Clostridia bacterium]|nr:hypothetical protein [Clostridia bacterium]
MYSRNLKKSGGLAAEEIEIAKYGLPPKYDGSRFRRAPEPEDGGWESDPAPDEVPEEGREPAPRGTNGAPPSHRDGDGSLRRDGDGSLRRDGERGKIERLIEGLGERLGTEELLIIGLILILSGAGGGECEDAGDVILLLALLLILG